MTLISEERLCTYLTRVLDLSGLLLTVVVHGAYWQDQDGAHFVFMKLKEAFHRLKVIFGDSAYNRNGLPDWVKETCGYILQPVLRPVNVKGFVVLPKRWIVERTFARLTANKNSSPSLCASTAACTTFGRPNAKLNCSRVKQVTIVTSRLAIAASLRLPS